MTANPIPPIPPNPALDDAPITHMFKTPGDVLAAAAAQRQQDPELLAQAHDVAAELDRYLDGALTLRAFARMHTPYERYQAVRTLGRDSPHFAPFMGVLDQLIALHRDGKTPERPRNAGRPAVPTVTRSGRHECAHCRRAQFLSAGGPRLCTPCRQALGRR